MARVVVIGLASIRNAGDVDVLLVVGINVDRTGTKIPPS